MDGIHFPKTRPTSSYWPGLLNVRTGQQFCRVERSGVRCNHLIVITNIGSRSLGNSCCLFGLFNTCDQIGEKLHVNINSQQSISCKNYR